MTLSTEQIFLTDEQEGFRVCRETRTTSTATMTVLFCEAGFIDVYYHGAMLRINPGELFVRIPDFSNALGPYEMSPDFAFKQITVEARVYEQIMYDHMRVEPNWYAKQEYLKENPCFKLNEVSREFFEVYFHLIALQLQDKQTHFRQQIIRYLTSGGMLELLNYMDKLAVVQPSIIDRIAVNQSDYTFSAFMRLIQNNPHKREVQWFAKQLDITPKYLSEICKERSSKSASEWIAEVTISEMKHYLRDTTLPIREIARIMEFPNSSFFCQYTRKHMGVTPNHFRREKSN